MKMTAMTYVVLQQNKVPCFMPWCHNISKPLS